MNELHHIMQQFQARLYQLEQENQQLKQDLDNIKPIVIENVNYKIQELHVQELKGTLNIGMTGATKPEDIAPLMDNVEEDDDDVQNK